MRGREFKTLLSIYPKQTKTVTQKDIRTPTLIAALFTIAKIWKQPQCPLIDEGIKKLCVCVCVCVCVCFSHKKE